ncbi:hypothetical protein J6590_099835 [Homalodisca vitripennis]|nr:hypothetical protein J6590_099835 [Homalodisca vitripennis]
MVCDIINNKTQVSKQIKLKVGNRLLQDGVDVSHAFNRFFASVPCGRGPLPSELKFVPQLRQSPAVSMVLVPVREEEPDRIVQQLPA